MKHNGEVRMDNKKAKTYILDTTAIQDGRTLEKQLYYFRNGSILCILGFLFMLFWVAFIMDNADDVWMFVFLITLLLTAVVAVMAFKRSKHITNTQSVTDDSKDVSSGSSYIGVIGSLAGVGGMFLVRMLNLSQNIMLIGGGGGGGKKNITSFVW